MMCNKMYVERGGTTEISEEFIINNEFVNLLNENMIASCVCTYPAIDWVTDDCTKYKIQFVNFSYENDTINVNFRLYNPTETNEVVCVIDVEAMCKA